MSEFKPTSIFGRDLIEFKDYFNRGGRTAIGHHARVFYCVEPLKYIGQEEVQSDIDNLKTALQGKKIEEAFLPAIAPGTMEHWMKNEYYPSDEAYLFAIAEAMREEYKTIIDAGFVLQIDISPPAEQDQRDVEDQGDQRHLEPGPQGAGDRDPLE